LVELMAQNELVLVGSRSPIAFDRGAWRGRAEDPAVREYLGDRLSAELVEIIRGARPSDPAKHPPAEPNLDLFPRDEFQTP
jgi:hypothetical protein